MKYFVFQEDAFLRWSDIDTISVQKDRLIIQGKDGATYRSLVVYRGDQARLLHALTQMQTKGTLYILPQTFFPSHASP